jgi:hypothetical protein
MQSIRVWDTQPTFAEIDVTACQRDPCWPLRGGTASGLWLIIVADGIVAAVAIASLPPNDAEKLLTRTFRTTLILKSARRLSQRVVSQLSITRIHPGPAHCSRVMSASPAASAMRVKTRSLPT